MNFFLGRKVRYCGWHDADNLRLFDKEKVGYDLDFKYLESMKVSGAPGRRKIRRMLRGQFLLVISAAF